MSLEQSRTQFKYKLFVQNILMKLRVDYLFWHNVDVSVEWSGVGQ